MRLMTGSSILNIVMCSAAFGVVALVVMFAHPVARSSRMTTLVNAPISGGVADAGASFKPVGAALLRHGAAE